MLRFPRAETSKGLHGEEEQKVMFGSRRHGSEREEAELKALGRARVQLL